VAYDLKYGEVHAEYGERVHGKPGVPLNESTEPVFIIRAQDVASVNAIAEYFKIAESLGAEFHGAGLAVIEAFSKWQAENSDLVKVPD
jgi:hypothetical protein